MLFVLLELLAFVLVLLFSLAVGVGVDQWSAVLWALLDVPTWLMIVIFVLPILLTHGMWRDFIRAVRLQREKYTCSLNEMKKSQYAVRSLQKGLLYGGLIITLLEISIMLFYFPTYDVGGMWAMGHSLAIALIPLLYVAMLELLLLPLEIGVRRRILEFMEEE